MNVVSGVPYKLSKFMNLLGDCMSSRRALAIIDDVSAEYDKPVRDIQRRVQQLWREGMSKRSRKELASRLNIQDGDFLADYVGQVRLDKEDSFVYIYLSM